MKSIITFIFIFCMVIPPLTAQEKYVLPDGITQNDYMQGKIIFKFIPSEKDNFSNRDIQLAFSRINVTNVVQKFPHSPIPTKKLNEYGMPLVDLSLIYELTYDSETEIDYAINLLLQCGLFEYATPHIIPQLLYTPNDPNISNQYYLNNIQAYQAWDIHKGDSTYIIGIADTGFEFAHPDLVSAVAYNYNDPEDGIDNDNDGYIDNFKGWDMGSFDNNPQYDTDGHGIHVSGIAGARCDNTFGMAGVSFNCKILPVKIDNQYGNLTATYEGVIYAADHGADFINCSWGSTFSSGPYGQDIVNYVTHNCNALVVAAAGNSNNISPFYPASYTYALGIAATNIDDEKWSNSSYGYTVDFSAPGQDIYSTWAGSSFVTSSGTSMASPCAAGCAAFVASYYPTLNYLQIAERLRNTTDYIDTLPGNIPYANMLGTGRVNLYRAITDTFRPGVRMIDFNATDNENEIFGPGDTLDITMDIINYLETSDSLYAMLECIDPWVEMIDSSWYIGILSTLQDTINNSNPFRFRINDNTPPSTKLNFIVHFIDSSFNYNSPDYLFFSINKDYLSLDTNLITTTITSHGNIGYNDLKNYIQGEGFRFNGASSIIAGSGFMFGSSNQKVSDNLYSIIEPLDSDFVSTSFVQKINHPYFGDQCILSKYNDSGAETAFQNHISVTQYSYAWDTPEDENYVIIRYEIINNDTIDINNAYASHFCDWDIQTENANRCFYDTATKSLISITTDSSRYAAVKLLSSSNGIYYAGDIDGFNGSITIDDGFTDMEKYTMMTTNRWNAGSAIAGNDVTAMVSSGPFTISVGDTLVVSFALIAGYTYLDIVQGATNAELRYNDPLLRIEDNSIPNFNIYPNPAQDIVHIMYSDNNLNTVLQVFDQQGRLIIEKSNIEDHTDIDISSLNQGLYFFVLRNKNGQSTRRLIKLQ